MALSAGMRVGPYEILAPLGAGGMGEVYRARDTRLDRTVAIKVLPAELADSPKRIGGIVVDVELPNGVPEDKKEAIRRMAELCPVHETLRNPPRVDVDIM